MAAPPQRSSALSLGISAMESSAAVSAGRTRSRRGPAHLRPGHRRGHPRGPHHLPRLLRFRHNPDQGPRSRVRHPAQRVQPDAFGAAVDTLFFRSRASRRSPPSSPPYFREPHHLHQRRVGSPTKRALASAPPCSITVLSLPCALGFNVPPASPFRHRRHSIHRGLHRVEQLLPLGSLLYVVFCVSRKAGAGTFPCRGRCGHGHEVALGPGWLTFRLPALIIIIFIMGYVQDHDVGGFGVAAWHSGVT